MAMYQILYWIMLVFLKARYLAVYSFFILIIGIHAALIRCRYHIFSDDVQINTDTNNVENIEACVEGINSDLRTIEACSQRNLLLLVPVKNTADYHP